MNIRILILLFLTFISCSHKKQNSFISPDGNLQVIISDNNELCQFYVVYQKDTIIERSVLGLHVNDIDLSKNAHISNIIINEHDEIWYPTNGMQSTVRNNFNEYLVELSHNDNYPTYRLIFRLFIDGFAYKYDFFDVGKTDSILIQNEITELNLMDDFRYWTYNGENHNIGPLKRSEKKSDKLRIPLVAQLNNQMFLGIHEAEIINFAPFSLNAASDDYSFRFNTNYSAQNIPFTTSWRVFIFGENPGDLLESNIIVNLNKACTIEDTSWIKPGKVMWDWRVWGYKAEDGFEYGLNTTSHKRFIDFASENNIQYLLLDADWYGDEFNENSDPTSSREGVDIEDCMQYANKKGIGIILYLNDIGAKKFGLERVLKQFSSWGAIGVKYGFMRGTAEQKVRQTKKVIELCARYKLMVNFHDNPVPPGGERRTWPNLMSKEFGHSQADAKKSYFPETAVTSPFVNMIAGPLDMCNGWFDLNNAHSRVKVFEEIPGTVAAELAKLIVTYTGWMVLPDSPEEYLKKEDLFDCIRKMPAQFDSFTVLDGEIGEFITVARGANNDWFIGSLTNRNSRSINIDLSFLPIDNKYEATIYSDKEDSHFLNNKESYIIQKQIVDSRSKLKVRLSAGGGNAIYLENIIE